MMARMSNELRVFTVNLKSMDQDISDPIVASAGDANGRTLRVIFDEEAAAQMTDETQVYLSWVHKQLKIKGYNVFTKVKDDPITWEIKYPKALLHKGDVLACIEIVDSVSVTASTNFIIHVLEDPNDGSSYVVSDDYSVFQEAVIQMNCLGEQAQKQLRQMRIEFEDMMLQASRYDETVKEIKEQSDKSYEMAQKAIEKSETIVSKEDLQKAIAEAGHLSYKVVDKLPEVADAKVGTVYLLSLGIDDPNAPQRYKEYVFINGGFEQIGDTANDLSNYVTLNQLYAAKDEVSKDAKKYTDDQVTEFKTTFTKEVNDTVTQMGQDIQTKANEYAKGYADKVLDDAKSYTDSLSESVADMVGIQDLPEGKSVKDYIDENVKSVNDKLGDIPEGKTVKDYVDESDKKLSDKIGNVPEAQTVKEYVDSLVGDISPETTVAEHVKKQVEEAQPDLNEFF